LKLCNKPAWHNWETPSNIAKEFGVSRKYILLHFKELISLGLAIYLEDDRMIGISRFPGEVEERLHPASTDTAHIPWKYLLRGSVRPL
jgi:predicted DNA-binding transcriptional regulator YafY